MQQQQRAKCSRDDCRGDALTPDAITHVDRTTLAWASAEGVRRRLCAVHFYEDIHGDTRCRIDGCSQEHAIATLRKEVGCRERALLAQPIAFTHAQLHQFRLPCRLPFCNDREAERTSFRVIKDVMDVGRMTLFAYPDAPQPRPPYPLLLCTYHSFVNPLVFTNTCIRPACLSPRASDETCQRQDCARLATRLGEVGFSTARAVVPILGYSSVHKTVRHHIGERASALVLYMLADEITLAPLFRFAEQQTHAVATCRFQGCDMRPALDAMGRPEVKDADQLIPFVQHGPAISHADFHRLHGDQTPCHFPFCVRRGLALDMLLVTRSDALNAAPAFTLHPAQRTYVTEQRQQPERTCLFHMWCHPVQHPRKCITADCLCPRDASQESCFCTTHLRFAQRVAFDAWRREARTQWHTRFEFMRQVYNRPTLTRKEALHTMTHLRTNATIAVTARASEWLYSENESSAFRRFAKRLQEDTLNRPDTAVVAGMTERKREEGEVQRGETAWMYDTDGVAAQVREHALERETRRAKGEAAQKDRPESIVRSTELVKMLPAAAVRGVKPGKLRIQHEAFSVIAPYLESTAASMSVQEIEQSRPTVLQQRTIKQFKTNAYLTFIGAGFLFYDWLAEQYTLLRYDATQTANTQLVSDAPRQLLPLLFDRQDILTARQLFGIYASIVARGRYDGARYTVVSCYPKVQAVLRRAKMASNGNGDNSRGGGGGGGDNDTAAHSAMPQQSSSDAVWSMLDVQEDTQSMDDETKPFEATNPAQSTIIELLCAMLYYACYTRGRVAPCALFANLLLAHLERTRLSGLFHAEQLEVMRRINPETKKAEAVRDAEDKVVFRMRSRRRFAEEVRGYVRLQIALVRGCEGARHVFGHLFKSWSSAELAQCEWRWICAAYTTDRRLFTTHLAAILVHKSDVPRSKGRAKQMMERQQQQQQKQRSKRKAASIAKVAGEWFDEYVPMAPYQQPASTNVPSPLVISPVVCAARAVQSIRAALERIIDPRTDEQLQLLAQDNAFSALRGRPTQSLANWLADIIGCYYSPCGNTTSDVVLHYLRNGGDDTFDKNNCCSVDYLEVVEAMHTAIEEAEANATMTSAFAARCFAVFRSSICPPAIKLPTQLLWELSVACEQKSPAPFTALDVATRLRAMSLFWTALKTPTLANAFMQKSQSLRKSPMWYFITKRSWWARLFCG
jgi:hypothetical protein